MTEQSSMTPFSSRSHVWRACGQRQAWAQAFLSKKFDALFFFIKCLLAHGGAVRHEWQAPERALAALLDVLMRIAALGT